MLKNVTSGLLATSALALAVLLVCGSASAELEDYSSAEIEDLLRTLDYMEYNKRSGGGVDYEADYPSENDLMRDYYDDLASDVSDPMAVDASEDQQNLASMMEDFSEQQQQQQQMEMMNHGSPISHAGSNALPPAAHPGTTTKANPKNPGAVLPAYCDPPNPCPIGYDNKDGCIEDFENSSEFSRNFQARQNCLCDSEHMFNCPLEEEQGGKMMNDPFMAGMPPSLNSHLEPENPFLAGTKLPIAAKKGMGY